jgi:uncharacterized membrane protein
MQAPKLVVPFVWVLVLSVGMYIVFTRYGGGMAPDATETAGIVLFNSVLVYMVRWIAGKIRKRREDGNEKQNR